MLESVITHRANCCRFWEAVQQLKALPQKDVQDKVDEIWTEFLASDASCPINVDSKSYEITKRNMETLDRWSFDVAAVSIHTAVTKCSREHRIVRLFFINYITSCRAESIFSSYDHSSTEEFLVFYGTQSFITLCTKILQGTPFGVR
jgi:hypothetical protein